jgi:hypothetical protein
MLTVACRSWVLLLLVKWMSWYFWGVKAAPCLVAYWRHLSCASSSFLQLALVVSPNARMLELSTNPIAVTPFPSSSGRRVDVKNRKRIGESVDPCSIPVVCDLVQSRYSPSLRQVILSCRNDWMNLMMLGGKAFILRLWMSLLWDTLSNASDTIVLVTSRLYYFLVNI